MNRDKENPRAIIVSVICDGDSGGIILNPDSLWSGRERPTGASEFTIFLKPSLIFLVQNKLWYPAGFICGCRLFNKPQNPPVSVVHRTSKSEGSRQDVLKFHGRQEAPMELRANSKLAQLYPGVLRAGVYRRSIFKLGRTY